jgi:hypothetical protein
MIEVAKVLFGPVDIFEALTIGDRIKGFVDYQCTRGQRVKLVEDGDTAFDVCNT